MTRILALMLTALLLAGCSSIAFVQHAWQGQHEVMALSVPIAELLDNPDTDPALKARLAAALAARRFASHALGLPDNPSYTRYSALPRPYALWNLFVAPALSLEPIQHCYLFTGCLAYKGYFSREEVEVAAQRWRRRGMDVFIGDIPAYSTLGWYDDPLLSSMLHGDDDFVALTLFHELAHQRFYLKDDTVFNESFASFVGQQGLRQWRASNGLPPPDPTLAKQQAEFNALVMVTRARLQVVYTSDLPEAEARIAKSAEFARLRSDYAQWRDERWNASTRFDGWFAGELNNASLLPFGLYDYWVPAFAMLFDRAGRDWPAFYQAVERLGSRSPVERERALLALLAKAHRAYCSSQTGRMDQRLIASDNPRITRESGCAEDHR